VLHFSGEKESITTNTSEQITEIEEADTVKKIDFQPQILAQNASATNGGVYWVDIESLNDGYLFNNEIERELNGLQSMHERKILSKRTVAQKKYADMQSLYQKGLLTPETSQIREQELMELQQQIQKLDQEASFELSKRNKELNNRLFDKINSFLNEYSQEINCNYILGYGAGSGFILYANDSLDVTDEVLTGLNKAYKANKK
jgi:outer membrane protein